MRRNSGEWKKYKSFDVGFVSIWERKDNVVVLFFIEVVVVINLFFFIFNVYMYGCVRVV